MRGIFRFATAAVLLAGISGAAQAQVLTQRSVETRPGGYEAVAVGRSVAVDRPAYASGTVPPSEDRTVMGLSVPR